MKSILAGVGRGIEGEGQGLEGEGQGLEGVGQGSWEVAGLSQLQVVLGRSEGLVYSCLVASVVRECWHTIKKNKYNCILLHSIKYNS